MALEYGILLALASMMAWGVYDFTIAIVSRKVGALRTSLWVTVVTALAFALLLITYGIPALTLPQLMLTLSVAVAAVVGILSFTKAFRVGQVTVVSPIVSAWVVVTILLSIVLLNEKLDPVQSVGIMAIILGGVLISFKWDDLVHVRWKNAMKGVGYALLSLCASGFYFFLLSVLTSQIGWFPAAFLYNIPMIAMFIVIGAATERRIAFPIDRYGILTIVVGVLSFAAVLTYSAAVSYSYTALVAAIVSASPILTVMLAMALLKERLRYSQLFGIAMVIAGLIAVSFW